MEKPAFGLTNSGSFPHHAPHSLFAPAPPPTRFHKDTLVAEVYMCQKTAKGSNL